MPETLAPVILRNKAKKLRKETGDERYQTLEELERRPLSETLKVALLRPIIMLLTEPIVIFFSFCTSIAILEMRILTWSSQTYPSYTASFVSSLTCALSASAHRLLQTCYSLPSPSRSPRSVASAEA